MTRSRAPVAAAMLLRRLQRALRRLGAVVAAADDAGLAARALRVALGRDGDRAGRAVQQPLPGAAGQHAAGAAGVGGADHDQGRVLLLGEIMEPVGR